MDISVIVVTYNQEHTIARTLDSILAQRTAAAYEIVIGDDCSTAVTAAVCRRYPARFPGRVTHRRRGGSGGEAGRTAGNPERKPSSTAGGGGGTGSLRWGWRAQKCLCSKTCTRSS